MSKIKKYKYNEDVPHDPMVCPKCYSELEIARKKFLTKKDLKKQWFYSQFLSCPKCSYNKLDNTYKIIIKV